MSRRCAHPVEWQEDGRYECRNCGRRLAVDAYNRLQRPVRHRGEPPRTVRPAPADAAAFSLALDLGERIADQLPDLSSREELVRAVVEEIYRAGLLRRTPLRTVS
ncbi:hypothetical protein ACQP10_37820 (plasmid) [Streptosporangium sandarakinum]|uniref:hypothetical protein n=1 Tax=Streptosporangium sandarakinum TaxID=1260955 RepID=UPI003D8C100E